MRSSSNIKRLLRYLLHLTSQPRGQKGPGGGGLGARAGESFAEYATDATPWIPGSCRSATTLPSTICANAILPRSTRSQGAEDGAPFRAAGYQAIATSSRRPSVSSKEMFDEAIQQVSPIFARLMRFQEQMKLEEIARLVRIPRFNGEDQNSSSA